MNANPLRIAGVCAVAFAGALCLAPGLALASAGVLTTAPVAGSQALLTQVASGQAGAAVVAPSVSSTNVSSTDGAATSTKTEPKVKTRTVALALPASSLASSSAASATTATRSADPAEAIPAPTLVPHDLIRSFDPITLFMYEDAGPAGGGDADASTPVPGTWPAHPGAFRWLDARTLQFRPAEPWPVDTDLRISVGKSEWTLRAIMEPPTRAFPEAGATGLNGLTEIALDFAGRLDAALLSKRLRVGYSANGADDVRWLASDRVGIKVLERHMPTGPFRAVINLPGTAPADSTLRLELKLSESSSAPVWKYAVQTAPLFRVVGLGCANRRYPVPVDGVQYADSAPLRCDTGERVVAVEFSSTPARNESTDAALALASLVSVSPQLSNMTVTIADRLALVRGDFAPGVRYQVTLAHVPLRDSHGRALRQVGPASVSVEFPIQPAFVSFGASHGVAERHGAKHVPVSGRGDSQVDLRVHRIDPLDRDFWPFPNSAVVTDERQRPPDEGELSVTPKPGNEPAAPEVLAKRIRALGSPGFSSLVSLPIGERRPGARFGLDLAPVLEAMNAGERAGTYLVGIRRAADGSERQWMRLQVTDLALGTVRNANKVRLVVTRISTGEPLAEATVRVEGTASDGRVGWKTLFEGSTDASGAADWHVVGGEGGEVQRIIVTHDDDRLVLNPHTPPDRYADGSWQPDEQTWLQWTRENKRWIAPSATLHCHVFTERPVYRPSEPIHIKGWLRTRFNGQFEPQQGKGTLFVYGPAGEEWRYPVALSKAGGFYQFIDEPAHGPGQYSVRLQLDDSEQCPEIAFRKEAYKLPEVELRLHGDARVALDASFGISATAHYYAGGLAADRPIRWRVTQFPYNWSPQGKDDFVFAASQRYGVNRPLGGESVLDREVLTDASGAAEIRIDPAVEPSAAARRYVVEATLTGTDGRTVTATREILGLPAFALGVRMPRVLRDEDTLRVDLVSMGANGAFEAGRTLEVVLRQRQWHAQLRAGDFSSGVARYITEPVDRELNTLEVTSRADGPVSVDLPLDGAGVYLVEVTSRDALGRVQSVRRDVFATGENAVTWSRPPARVFQVSADKDAYVPGETATLVLQSPYQSARALAVIEAPEGNQYQWLEVKNGAATLGVPVNDHYAPNLPVHFVLYRGRVAARPGVGGLDLGRPATLAGGINLNVKPSTNTLGVAVDMPARATPGATINATVSLSDQHGQPVTGEVALWLVDRAVLALGREQRINPVPDFLVRRVSRVAIHDSRNTLFGFLPLAEFPGGGAGDAEPRDLLDNVTVRRRFVPVAFYAPNIQVDASGKATLPIELPDNLTHFAVRAKAVSGKGRFGHAVGNIAVRLPLVTQPALPRFVRPGDTFDVGATVRVIDGDVGPGQADLAIEGLETGASKATAMLLAPGSVHKLRWPVTVAASAGEQVDITVRAVREADGAGDGFAVSLPVIADRQPVFNRRILTLPAGEALDFMGPSEPVRIGSLSRDVRVAADPAITALLGAVSTLSVYPYACTEQRIARVRAGLALDRFSETLGVIDNSTSLGAALEETFIWMDAAIDERNLMPYWPGGRGYVSLTAWSLQLLVSARQGGYEVPEPLEARLVRSLRRALRSDYPALVDGSEFAERAWALAALTDAGHTEPGYSAELAQRAQFFNLENLAQIVRILAANGPNARVQAEELAGLLWEGITTGLRDGREVVAGITDSNPVDGVLLPGEVRTMAELLRTAVMLGDDHRTQLLREAVVARADGNGWGDTNANASALAALTDTLEMSGPEMPVVVSAVSGDTRSVLRINARRGVDGWHSSGAESLRLSHATRKGPPLQVIELTRYVPKLSGALASAQTAGLVVRREWLRLRDGAIAERIVLDEPGSELIVAVGDIIEAHIEVVNPASRHHVAVVSPLGAGFEPLNPALDGAPPDATPSQSDSVRATYRALGDHEAAWFFDTLAAGTVHLRYRVRAVTPGRFVQPPARAEMMYDRAVRASSPGAWLRVRRSSAQ
jgi:uncharacterized protein YfaS (alpha-2-macroglobulin family)